MKESRTMPQTRVPSPEVAEVWWLRGHFQKGECVEAVAEEHVCAPAPVARCCGAESSHRRGVCHSHVQASAPRVSE